MAKKKKQEEAPAGSPAWMATFSDLMNLLLCFFVLLYSMSSIDAEKYDIIRASLSNTVNIFQSNKSILNGKTAIESGIEQIENLEEYIKENQEQKEGEKGEANSFKDAYKEMTEQKKEYATDMYDEISEMFDKKDISSDRVGISVDSNYNYVKLTIDGSILFASGSATLKKEALPTLSKVGDILKVYSKYMIEVEGHTDNVPITSNPEFDDNMWLSTARALNTANYLIETKGINPTNVKSSGRGEYDPVAKNNTAEGRQKNRRVEIKIYNQLSSY